MILFFPQAALLFSASCLLGFVPHVAGSLLDQAGVLSIDSDDLQDAGFDKMNITIDVSSAISNATAPMHGNIYCRNNDPKFGPTTVAGCRPTLNTLRDLPNFGKRQLFKYGPPRTTPRELGEPPTEFMTPEGDCGVFVDVRAPAPLTKNSFEAWFSWKDVRAVATEVIQYCADEHWGRGGLVAIGDPAHDANEPGWIVAGVGKQPTPSGTPRPVASDIVDTFAR